jgi:hypothetical protein
LQRNAKEIKQLWNRYKSVLQLLVAVFLLWQEENKKKVHFFFATPNPFYTGIVFRNNRPKQTVLVLNKRQLRDLRHTAFFSSVEKP